MTHKPTFKQCLKCYTSVILEKLIEQFKLITIFIFVFFFINLGVFLLFHFPFFFKAILILAISVHVLYSLASWENPYGEENTEINNEEFEVVKTLCKPVQWNRVLNFAKSVYYWLSVLDLTIIIWLLKN